MQMFRTSKHLLVLTISWSIWRCIDGNSTAASTTPQCDPAIGLQRFIGPVVSRYPDDPAMSLPPLMLADLDLQSRHNERVESFWGTEPLWGLPNLHPCLRINFKSVLAFGNPLTMIDRLMQHIKSGVVQDRNVTGQASQATSTHVHSVFVADGVISRVGVTLEAWSLVYFGQGRLMKLQDKSIYGYFVRTEGSVLRAIQPLSGFYKLWHWRACSVIYSMEDEGQEALSLFLAYSMSDVSPSDFANPAPIYNSVPFERLSARSQLYDISHLPSRLVFLVGEVGSHFRAMDISGLDFKTLLVNEMRWVGLWFPRFQIVGDTNILFADFMIQDETFRRKLGLPEFGAFFGVEPKMNQDSMVVTFLPKLIRLFDYLPKVDHVDLSDPAEQSRYGMDDWPQESRQFAMERVFSQGGLNALFWSSPLWMLAIVEADFHGRCLLAFNCYLHGGGRQGVLDPNLLLACIVNEDHRAAGASTIFSYGFSSNAELTEDYVLVGPAWFWDSQENMSIQTTTNAVVWVSGSSALPYFVYSKGGAAMGFLDIVWANGDSGMDPPDKLRKCLPGMYQTTLGICSWCLAGRFSNATDVQECYHCEVGSVSGVRSTRCTQCRPGFYDGYSGSSSWCTICGIGTFTALHKSSRCDSCPFGKWSDAIGSSECVKCNERFTTGSRGEVTHNACVCPRGTYASGRACLKCQHGLECEEGWPFNWAAMGGTPILSTNFYSFRADPYSVYLCRSDFGGCPGGAPENCDSPDGATGRTGFLCMKCNDSGYHVVDGICKQCPMHLKLFLLFLVLACILIIFVAYYMVNDTLSVNTDHLQAFVVFAGNLITTFQIFVVLKDLRVPWPKFKIDFLNGPPSVFALDVGSISMTCIISDNNIEQYAAQGAFPFALLMMVVMVMISTRLICRYLQKPSLSWTLEETLNLAGQIAQALFIAFCIIMVRPLHCYEHPNGKMSVVTFPSVVCYEGEHAGMIAVSVSILCLFIAPFFACCVYGSWKAPSRTLTSDTAFLKAFHFLLFRFRPDRWWWGLVVLVRQTALAFTTSLYPSKPHMQLLYLSCILIVYLWLAGVFWPWINGETSILDCLTCLIFVLILIGAAQFLPEAAGDDRKTFLIILMFTMGFLYCRYIIVFILSIFMNGLWGEFDGQKPIRSFLCLEWFSFLAACQESRATDMINAIFEMNAFDRRQLMSVVQDWGAYSKGAMQIQPRGKRLSGLLSRTTVDLTKFDDTKSKVMQMEVAKSLSNEGPSEAASIVPKEEPSTSMDYAPDYEHVNSQPRALRVLASVGMPMTG